MEAVTIKMKAQNRLSNKQKIFKEQESRVILNLNKSFRCKYIFTEYGGARLREFILGV